MRFRCRSFSYDHKRKKEARQHASNGNTSEAPATQPEVELPQEESVDSESLLTEKPDRSQHTVHYETPTDESTDAISATSAGFNWQDSGSAGNTARSSTPEGGVSRERIRAPREARLEPTYSALRDSRRSH